MSKRKRPHIPRLSVASSGKDLDPELVCTLITSEQTPAQDLAPGLHHLQALVRNHVLDLGLVHRDDIPVMYTIGTMSITNGNVVTAAGAAIGIIIVAIAIIRTLA